MMANFTVPYRITLGELLPEAVTNPAIAALAVRGLDNNSRTIEAGDLFLACPGAHSDGRDYIDDAILRGAAAVFYEQGDGYVRKQDCVAVNQVQVPVIPVANLAQQASRISAHYFHQPAQQLCCIGITGTNGKTTCAWWLAHLLSVLGKKTGLVGTLGYGVIKPDEAVSFLRETGFTTPDAIQLQHILAGFVQAKATHAVMEVSSHSLDQGRVGSVKFSTVLFTNLSRDHLDYHGTLENYGAAKARLFAQPGLQRAVINVDDVFGAALALQLKSGQAANGLVVVTCSVKNPAADVFVKNLRQDMSGVSGRLMSPWGEAALVAPVHGEYNIANLLGVIASLCSEGFALQEVIRAIGNLPAPPGRLEKVSRAADAVAVFVDFAHTPDALEKVLTTLRQQTKGKLWCVFGCGGDRDSGKRPLMGDVASRHADHCIVTSDNPRSEDPQMIINQIVSRCDTSRTLVIMDRKQAIAHAIQAAASGDVVLLAGKGHENYQEIKGVKWPLRDAEEATKALRARQGGDQ